MECTVLYNGEVAPGCFRLVMSPPADATPPLPGQFYSIRCGGSTVPLLRRPFSVHRRLEWNGVEFLYRVIGKGTSWLAERRAGDVLDVLGPLGNGFSLQEDVTHAVLVARGIGIAPLYALGEAILKKASDVRLSILIGARLKQRLFYREELEALGSVYWYTDDGSEGFKGRAAELLRHLLVTGVLPRHCTLYACGPDSMLKELADVASEHGLRGQAALETHMGCGFGACLSCAVPLKPQSLCINTMWKKPALQWSEDRGRFTPSCARTAPFTTCRRLTGMNGSPDLTVRLGRLELKNPVMPASGTFGYGQEYASFLDLNRLGAVTVKTITLKPRIGSYPHRSTEVPSGLLSTIGLQNVGIERFIKEKLPFFDQITPALIVNIGGESIEEYVTLARMLDAYSRINALEVNVSCPNVHRGGMHFGVDPHVMEDLIARIRSETEKPLIVKLTPMVTDISMFAQIAKRCGADAVSLINAPVGMAVDIRTKRSRLGRNPTGGLTGPAIRPLALYLVRRVFKSVEIPVIGIGGITKWEDAVEFFLAGASAVQIGTMNFIHPGAAVDVIDGIRNYLLDAGINSLSQLIGTLRE
ncbi:MAG: dihydroorotate dehydrogenase [Deltaproteobacteria bacterium]|nr:dihydroorotate dehydrogenase [Deltaproteobacteria bacterium]